jgi:hypothetical protein
MISMKRADPRRDMEFAPFPAARPETAEVPA